VPKYISQCLKILFDSATIDLTVLQQYAFSSESASVPKYIFSLGKCVSAYTFSVPKHIGQCLNIYFRLDTYFSVPEYALPVLDSALIRFSLESA